MTRSEDLLADVLRERAEGRDVRGTPMSDVVATAGRIRRARRIRAGVATAVVVGALASPFLVDAARSPDASTDPAGPSTTEVPPPPRLQDLAPGAPPAIRWIDGGDVVASDGTRVSLPFDDVTRATPYLGGFLVARFGDPRLVLLDDRGREVWRRCTTGALGVSDDGSRTAYTTVGCGGGDPVLHVGPTLGTDDEWTAPVPLADGAPVGLLDDGVVVASMNTAPPALVRPDGTARSLDRLGVAAAVNEPLGLVSGNLAGSAERNRTGAVVDAGTGEVLWSEKDWQLDDFSPDGSSVVGVELDGTGTRWGVFDARTGEQLHELATPAGLQIWQVAWEDADHLLLATTQDGAEAIVRVSLDGDLERATELVPAGEGARRFALGANGFR